MSKLENKLFHIFAYDWIGDGQRDSPPLTNDTLRMQMRGTTDEQDQHIVSLLNDAFEIWFGYPDRWKWHFSRKEFHKVIRWYLKRYIFVEWLGLRRKVYYWLLHRRVERFKAGKYDRANTKSRRAGTSS